MPRHIIFDIDDTLFPSTEFSSLARRNAVNAMIRVGMPGDFEGLHSRLMEIIGRTGPNHPGHFDELCREAGVKDPGRYIAAAVAAYHDTKTSIAPFPTVPLTLLTLRERGYRVHAATQGNSIKQWDKIIRLGLALYFERVFVSGELGVDKSEAFYLRVLESLEAKPEECMMVGDREDHDISPARGAGMATVRVLSGKHAAVPSKADHVIRDVVELLSILPPEND